jgi:murein DD-endopeptidase MepM/ murein hydrolase activator NlpD
MPFFPTTAFPTRAGRFVVACALGSACSVVAFTAMHTPAPVRTDAPSVSLHQAPAEPKAPKASPFVGPPAPVRVADSATVDQTFTQAAQSLGMDDATISDLSKAFGSKVDLTRDLRKGDTLSIVYDQTPGAHASDVPTDPLAVRLTTGSESHDVYLHRNLDGKALYYSQDGASTEPAFSRYPLDFTRVSSNFSPNRLDPVTHRWQSHDGVDLAAPIGTPVHAAAQGTIRFVGRQTGYGKMIVLDNPPPYSTVYAHLSRFAKGIKNGATVARGQVIGYVGETGWATGPHLHYEVRVNDVAEDPLTVALPNDEQDRLHGDERQRFAQQAATLGAML